MSIQVVSNIATLKTIIGSGNGRTEDSTNIIITLASAAPSGNTLTYAWEARV